MLMSEARLNGILCGLAAGEPVINIWTTASALCRHSCCFLCMLLCCYFQNKFCEKIPQHSSIWHWPQCHSLVFTVSITYVCIEYWQNTEYWQDTGEWSDKTKDLLQCKTMFDIFPYVEIIWLRGFVITTFWLFYRRKLSCNGLCLSLG